jgi:hypothetical protein
LLKYIVLVRRESFRGFNRNINMMAEEAAELVTIPERTAKEASSVET